MLETFELLDLKEKLRDEKNDLKAQKEWLEYNKLPKWELVKDINENHNKLYEVYNKLSKYHKLTKAKI